MLRYDGGLKAHSHSRAAPKCPGLPVLLVVGCGWKDVMVSLRRHFVPNPVQVNYCNRRLREAPQASIYSYQVRCGGEAAFRHRRQLRRERQPVHQQHPIRLQGLRQAALGEQLPPISAPSNRPREASPTRSLVNSTPPAIWSTVIRSASTARSWGDAEIFNGEMQ